MTQSQPEKVGRYEVAHPIGKGGFATVYLCRDPYINRAVALKVSDTGDASGKKTILSRLFKEAEAAGSLLHPNIVTIYDAGIQESLCYIAMEYVEGTTLFKNCTPENLLPVADALDIIIKVCHGLDYAHQRGVIHRDVKPSNILIGAHGEIKITDFGLACFAELAGEEPGTVGTPSYMPPEQVEGKASTPQSDLFSVGVILYQLLCGYKPFDAQGSLEMRRKILHDPPIPLSEKNPELPPALYEISKRALAKDPKDRYPTGYELARDLENVIKGKGRPLDGKIAEHIWQLKTLGFFEGFAEEEVANLLHIGTWLTHKDEEAIICEEDTGNAFYVITSGEATTRVGGKTVGRLTRGDCFGEISFLLGRKRSATISAVNECSLLKLNPEKIEILAPETQIKLYRLFAKTLAGYLLRAEGKNAA